MTLGDDVIMTDKLTSNYTTIYSMLDDRAFKWNERVAVKEHMGSYQYKPQYLIYSGKYKNTRVVNGITEHYIEIDIYTHKSKWFICTCIGQQEETVSHVLLKMAFLSHPKMPLALAEHYSNMYGQKNDQKELTKKN